MPFVGDIEEANVYLLQANPGVELAPLSEKSVSAKSEIKDEYRDRICNCLKQELDGYDYPFYFLDPDLWWTGGSVWWRDKLSVLIYYVAAEMWKDEIEEFSEDGSAIRRQDKTNDLKKILLKYLSETYKNDEEKREEKVNDVYKKIAQNICAVEIHGYRSQNYQSPKEFFPSSKFQVEIVKQALDENKLVVMMRSESEWKSLFEVFSKNPAQLDDKKILKLKNPRNVNISPKNFGDGIEDFKKLVKKIV
jgi:hypothetical protein